MKIKSTILILFVILTFAGHAQSDFDPETPCNTEASNDCIAAQQEAVRTAEVTYHLGLLDMASSFADCALEAYDADFINTESGSWSFWGAVEFLAGLTRLGIFVNTMQAINNCLDPLYAAGEELDNNFLDNIVYAEHVADNCKNDAGCEIDPEYYTPWP